MKAMSTSSNLGAFAKSLNCNRIAIGKSPKGKSILAIGFTETAERILLAFCTKAVASLSSEELKKAKDWDCWEYKSTNGAILNGTGPAQAMETLAEITL